MIRYKNIEHERVEDAPFMGALINSIDCHINCKDCFNQHLKTYPTIIKEAQDIINEVKSNLFNQGIIFGGLEWSEQPEEMLELITVALRNNLKVMIYSGLNYSTFINKFPMLNTLDIVLKCGCFKSELATENNIQYGIKLATSNQQIKHIK